MATRSRGRRGQPTAPAPAPQAATRSTRNASHDIQDLVVDDTQDQMMQGERINTVLATRDRPPRRSAPFAPSETSIPTRPEGGSEMNEVDEGEEDEVRAEEEDEGEDGREQPMGEFQATPELKHVDQEEDGTRLAVMAAGIPDARSLAEDLWTRLLSPDYENQQYCMILNMKRRTFMSIREAYEDTHIAPFIDTRRLGLLDEHFGESGVALTTLRKVNLTSALDTIDRILRGEDTNKIVFLQSLSNGVYPSLLSQKSDDYEPASVLDTLTQLLIERLIARGERSPRSILADVFCSGRNGTERDDVETLSRLLTQGPWVSLGGESKHEERMISDRIEELFPHVKTREPVAPLQRLYDPEAYYKNLRNFVIEAWPKEIFYDAADSLHQLEATPTAVDPRLSQQPGSAPARHFSQDMQSLAGASPSAARRQTMHPSAQHRRYPSPGTAFGASVEASRAAAQSLAELGELGSTDNDEADAFQTDSRMLAADNKRRSAPQGSGQQRQAKRQRINDANLPPSSMPPPSTAPPQYSTQPGATPDFEAIKAKKRALSAAARAERGEGPTQQRKPWSANDCTTLLHCIYERHASWSQIQSEDSHKFEIPRNQQAYRDKARNMKVDYLITDAVLPPCFDLVALGSKEKARLIAMGKNPNRREADIDDSGNPINISFISPEQQQLADSLSQTQHEISQQAPEPQMA